MSPLSYSTMLFFLCCLIATSVVLGTDGKKCTDTETDGWVRVMDKCVYPAGKINSHEVAKDFCEKKLNPPSSLPTWGNDEYIKALLEKMPRQYTLIWLDGKVEGYRNGKDCAAATLKQADEGKQIANRVPNDCNSYFTYTYCEVKRIE